MVEQARTEVGGPCLGSACWLGHVGRSVAPLSLRFIGYKIVFVICNLYGFHLDTVRWCSWKYFLKYKSRYKYQFPLKEARTYSDFRLLWAKSQHTNEDRTLFSLNFLICRKVLDELFLWKTPSQLCHSRNSAVIACRSQDARVRLRAHEEPLCVRAQTGSSPGSFSVPSWRVCSGVQSWLLPVACAPEEPAQSPSASPGRHLPASVTLG